MPVFSLSIEITVRCTGSPSITIVRCFGMLAAEHRDVADPRPRCEGRAGADNATAADHNAHDLH